jgi:hypothetical protein
MTILCCSSVNTHVYMNGLLPSFGHVVVVVVCVGLSPHLAATCDVGIQSLSHAVHY